MVLIDSILAGIAYGLGATAWFFIYDGTLFSMALGGICFAIVFMSIPYFKLDFFLGRPGLLTNKNIDFIEQLMVYLGNFIGLMWIGLLVKIFSDGHLISVAHYALELLHSRSWDTVLCMSIFAGMMFYAGSIALSHGIAPTYFMLISFVCIMCHWPTVHIIFYCLWVDTWADYWYLIFPVTLGNIIGSNLWVMLRKHSPTFKNEKYIKPDSDDIVDKFREFV